MRYLLVLVLAGVVAGLGLYAFQNTATSEVHFGWWTWSGVPNWYPVVGVGAAVLSVSVLYLILAGTGWRVRHLLLYRSKVQRDATLEDLHKTNQELREQVAALRAQVPHTSGGDGDGWTPLSARKTGLFRR